MVIPNQRSVTEHLNDYRVARIARKNYVVAHRSDWRRCRQASTSQNELVAQRAPAVKRNYGSVIHHP